MHNTSYTRGEGNMPDPTDTPRNPPAADDYPWRCVDCNRRLFGAAREGFWCAFCRAAMREREAEWDAAMEAYRDDTRQIEARAVAAGLPLVDRGARK